MKGYHIAVVGATGAVGAELLRVIERRNFSVASLRAIGSARSSGKSVRFHNDSILLEELTDRSFDKIDVAFFSAGGEISRKYVRLPARQTRLQSTTRRFSGWSPTCRWLFPR